MLLILLLTPFYQFLGLRFGPNATSFAVADRDPVFPARLRDPRMRWSAAAGATAALALVGDILPFS